MHIERLNYTMYGISFRNRRYKKEQSIYSIPTTDLHLHQPPGKILKHSHKSPVPSTLQTEGNNVNLEDFSDDDPYSTVVEISAQRLDDNVSAALTIRNSTYSGVVKQGARGGVELNDRSNELNENCAYDNNI